MGPQLANEVPEIERGHGDGHDKTPAVLNAAVEAKVSEVSRQKCVVVPGDIEITPPEAHRAVLPVAAVAPKGCDAGHPGHAQDLWRQGPLVPGVEELVDMPELAALEPQPLDVIETRARDPVPDRIVWPVVEFTQFADLMVEVGALGLRSLDFQPGAPDPPLELNLPFSQAVAECVHYEWIAHPRSQRGIGVCG